LAISLAGRSLESTICFRPSNTGKRLLKRSPDKIAQLHPAQRRLGFDSLEERIR
jgi:hypothetical protein